MHAPESSVVNELVESPLHELVTGRATLPDREYLTREQRSFLYVSGFRKNAFARTYWLIAGDAGEEPGYYEYAWFPLWDDCVAVSNIDSYAAPTPRLFRHVEVSVSCTASWPADDDVSAGNYECNYTEDWSFTRGQHELTITSSGLMECDNPDDFGHVFMYDMTLTTETETHLVFSISAATGSTCTISGTVEITLSDEYTPAMWEADIAALFAAYPVTSIPWPDYAGTGLKAAHRSAEFDATYTPTAGGVINDNSRTTAARVAVGPTHPPSDELEGISGSVEFYIEAQHFQIAFVTTGSNVQVAGNYCKLTYSTQLPLWGWLQAAPGFSPTLATVSNPDAGWFPQNVGRIACAELDGGLVDLPYVPGWGRYYSAVPNGRDCAVV